MISGVQARYRSGPRRRGSGGGGVSDGAGKSSPREASELGRSGRLNDFNTLEDHFNLNLTFVPAPFASPPVAPARTGRAHQRRAAMASSSKSTIWITVTTRRMPKVLAGGLPASTASRIWPTATPRLNGARYRPTAGRRTGRRQNETAAAIATAGSATPIPNWTGLTCQPIEAAATCERRCGRRPPGPPRPRPAAAEARPGCARPRRGERSSAAMTSANTNRISGSCRESGGWYRRSSGPSAQGRRIWQERGAAGRGARPHSTSHSAG